MMNELEVWGWGSHSWTTTQLSEDEAETECADCMVRPYNEEAKQLCEHAVPFSRAMYAAVKMQVVSFNQGHLSRDEIVRLILDAYEGKSLYVAT